MAVNDNREPAVYVNVQDNSYIGPTAETGRTVFGVILTDRGPHQRIVKVTSQSQYQKLFGIPDYQKCSQTHYMIDKALEFTGSALVCRVTPDDAALANVVIKDTSAVESVEIPGDFTWTATSSIVTCDPSVANKIYVGDLVYSTEDEITDALKVASVDVENGVITLEDVYAGTSGTTSLSKDVTNTITGAFTTVDTSLETLGEDYTGYGQIDCSLSDMDKVSVGSWVYLDTDTAVEARQVISLTENASGEGVITLDQPYTGTIGEGNLQSFTPFTALSQESILSEDDISGAFVYQFYANGSGTFYNNLVLKGVRNFELEKMYVDSEGNPYYSYVFLDLYLYHTNENGTQTLIEGPWSTSLTRKTPAGEIIVDFISGSPIYIVDVINTNSQYIRAVDGSQVANLIDSVSGTQKRLQLMTAMMQANPVGMNNVTNNGLIFSEGTDGTGMYNSLGILQPDDKLFGRCASAYNGSLKSVDGSIEMMPEQIYPVYVPDYVISGGFPAIVQLAAASLCNARQDCIHLADTGANYSNYLYDESARKTIVPWNFWTSALYVQYRKITDIYTGSKFWMSPVYHAIQCHLNTDNNYFIAEPVANIEKGAINDPITLAYQPNHTVRGDLLDMELNYTITETQGIYFATQLTTWKRYSALKRLHIAKFTAYLFRNIPIILKDVIQRKATAYWLSQANTRLNNFFLQFMNGVATDRYAAINAFSVTLNFDKTRSELNVYITYTPILSIERINVSLIIPATL